MNDADTRKGTIVVGIMLVLVGLAVALNRVGVITWTGPWTLWPLILGGIGLARFLQSLPDGPKDGLLFLTAAAWLLVVEAGWVTLEDSWPFLIIAFGLIIALNGGTRRRWLVPDQPGEPSDPDSRRQRRREWRQQRRHARPLGGLAVLGIWIAIVVALHTSGTSSFGQSTIGDGLHVVSVLGRSEHTSRPTEFHGGSITNAMGRSELDLRAATLAPGAEESLEVYSLMGDVVVRVPPTWTVDTRAVPAFGGVRDDRFPVSEPDASAGPAPRIVLRGLVVMGRLRITS